MQLTIGNKDYDVKFTFASLLAWRDLAKQQTDGKGLDDSDVYDHLFTGLANNNPMAATQVLYGGLAHMKTRPSFQKVFDAVNDLLNDMTAEELCTKVVGEIGAAGFFKAQLHQWMTTLESARSVAQEMGKQMDVPAKDATKEELDKYNETMYQLGYQESTARTLFDAMSSKINGTEATSSQPDSEQE